MIEMRKLRELVKLMKQNDLCELDIRDKDEQVTLKRPGSQGPIYAAPAPSVPAPAALPIPAPEADADAGMIKVISPMVGTFYTAASPDADAFVKVGSTVDKDTVVCVIEAMKVFNEIKAEVAGTVEKILVANGQSVEYGQALFLVKPN